MTVSELKTLADKAEEYGVVVYLEHTNVRDLIHDWTLMRGAFLATSESGHDINTNDDDEILDTLRLKP